MKYELVAENKEEERFLKSHTEFKIFMDGYLPVIQGRALMAGVHLKIFRTIRDKELTLKNLADKLVLDDEALGLLLNVLVCSGYLDYNKGKYILTDISKKTLLPGSESQTWGSIEYARIRWIMLNKLEDIIKTGKGVDFHGDYLTSHDSWKFYQRTMCEYSSFFVDEVASCVPVKQSSEKMLDIGGAHGLYGARICRKHPPMKSIVFDLPEAVEASLPLAHEAGIDDIVSFQSGDALKDDIGSGYDLVLVSNLCHHFTKEQNQDFLHRIIASLKKGGTLALYSVTPPDPVNNRNLFSAISSLMFCVNSGGQNYSYTDYICWAKTAGFEKIEMHPKFSEKTRMLIIGIK